MDREPNVPLPDPDLPKLNRYGREGLEHFRKFLPELTKELEQEGRLGAYLLSAQEGTEGIMDSLMKAGMSEQDAWEAAREEYLLRPPERGQPLTKREPHFDLQRELTRAQNEILKLL